jgi:ATP-dependent Clp protease ATP-binding subunit ClpC
MITGIPVHKVSENENKKLSKMRDAIEGKRQDDAVAKIVRSIQRGRVGMKDPNRPIFSGILIGILVLVKLNLLNN